MTITPHEGLVLLHGMFFGALFLLCFTGGLVGLYSCRPDWLTDGGIHAHLFRLRWGIWAMALLAWATCLTGTYLVYPWYRAAPPVGLHDLAAFPRSLLLSRPQTSGWHEFGMEWKEHLAWFAPVFSTTVAIVVLRYGPRLVLAPKVRRSLEILLTLSFVAAAGAGLFGALINKVAPIR